MENKIEEFIKNLDFFDIKDYLGYALEHFMVSKIGEAAVKAGFYVEEEKDKIDLTLLNQNVDEVAVIEFQQRYPRRDPKKIDNIIQKLASKPVPHKILITWLPERVDEIRKKVERASSKEKGVWIFGNIDFDYDEEFYKKFRHHHWQYKSYIFYVYQDGQLTKKIRTSPSAVR